MFFPLIGLAVILSLDLFKDNFTKYTVTLVTSAVSVLGPSLLVLVGAFFALINREYRHTFVSAKTGGQMLRRVSLEGDDVSKSQVFKKHRALWKPIEENVKAWVKAGWKQWGEEKPEWFTDAFKVSVPEAWIPITNGEEKVTVFAREENVDVIVRGEEKQGGHRKSLIDSLKSRKKNNKVVPEGMKEGHVFDVQEFKREMERRGIINM